MAACFRVPDPQNRCSSTCYFVQPWLPRQGADYYCKSGITADLPASHKQKSKTAVSSDQSVTECPEAMWTSGRWDRSGNGTEENQIQAAVILGQVKVSESHSPRSLNPQSQRKRSKPIEFSTSSPSLVGACYLKHPALVWGHLQWQGCRMASWLSLSLSLNARPQHQDSGARK